MRTQDLTAAAASKLGRHGVFHKRGTTAVLFVHGVTGTPAEMQSAIRPLAALGYTVACPQLAGHCSSLRELKATRWTDWYRSVVEAFDFLRAQCDVVFVSGLSMGALMALKLAADRPDEVRGVATMSATFFYDGWNVPRFRRRFLLPIVLSTPLRYFVSYREPPPFGIKDERVRKMVALVYGGNPDNAADKFGYSRFPAVTIRESADLIRDVERNLSRVVAPTLILHATDDDMASVENAKFLASKVGARRIEACYFDDTYHVLTLDRRKHDVAGRIGQFVARYAGDEANTDTDGTPSIELSRAESGSK